MKEYATTTLVVSQSTSRAQLSSNTAEQRKTHDTERREAGQHSKIAPFQIPDPSFRVVRGACLGRRLVAREGERNSEKESVERCFRALNLRRRNKGKKKTVLVSSHSITSRRTCFPMVFQCEHVVVVVVPV